MATQLNTNIKVSAPLPIDKRYLSERTIGGSPLPYSATTEVFSIIPSSERYIGLTVNINNVDYWFKNNTTNLILKTITGSTSNINNVTGGTNIGYFSGKTGIQMLNLSGAGFGIYEGDYYSEYNNYYRDSSGFVRLGTPTYHGALRRAYINSTRTVSWLFDQGLNAWQLSNFDITLYIGSYVPIIGYTGSGYTNTTWNGSNYNGSVLVTAYGSLNTGNTITIGNPVFSDKQFSELRFKTLKSKTPNFVNISNDDSFIYFSGSSSLIKGKNVGTGIGVYSGVTGNTLQFKSILGTGSTTVINNGGTILISSSNAITGATNGLTKDNLNIKLGGTLTGNTVITDNRVTPVGIQYGGNYAPYFTSRSLVDRGYVESVATGLIPKLAVKVATISAITLNGLTLIDGIPVTDGDRVLVKNQYDETKNGIYSASTSTWIRATDFNFVPTGEVAQGAIIPVVTGNTQKNTLWVLVTPNPIISGVTSLTFGLFNNPILNQGTGILIIGNTISVDGSSLAGNSINWTGNTFNVNINSGTLQTALNSKLNTTTFNNYSGITVPTNYYNKTQINNYTGKTNTVIINAITGATNGLTKQGNHDVVLGGTITGATTIAINSGGTLTIVDNRTSKIGIQYAANYNSGFTDNSLITKKYVDDNIINTTGATIYNLGSPAAITLGGIVSGTTLTGKTTNQILEELLVPTLNPTLIAPSSTIALNPSGTFEVGCNISTLCVTTAFNQGCICPQYSAICDKRSGDANHYCFTGAQVANDYACTSTSLIEYATNYIISAGTATWGSCVFYDAGVQPKNSKGGNYSTPLSSNNTGAQTATLTGIYPYFYGKCTCPGSAGANRPTATSSMVSSGTKIVASSSSSISINFNSGSDDYLWFAYPASNTDKTCWCITALNNGSIGGGISPACNLFPSSNIISVTTTCWSGQSYKVYISNKQTCVTSSMLIS